MIKYPVTMENPDAYIFTIEDLSGREIARGVDNQKEVLQMVTALNAMNEFPKAGAGSRWFSVGLNNWFHKIFPGYEPTHDEVVEYLKSIGRDCLCSECADT